MGRMLENKIEEKMFTREVPNKVELTKAKAIKGPGAKRSLGVCSLYCVTFKGYLQATVCKSMKLRLKVLKWTVTRQL